MYILKNDVYEKEHIFCFMMNFPILARRNDSSLSIKQYYKFDDRDKCVAIFLISLKSLDLMSRMRVNDREEEINANFNRSHLCKHREAPSLTYLTNFFCSSSFSRTSVQTAVNCARRVKILARLCLPIVSFRRITRRTNQNHRL